MFYSRKEREPFLGFADFAYSHHPCLSLCVCVFFVVCVRACERVCGNVCQVFCLNVCCHYRFLRKHVAR